MVHSVFLDSEIPYLKNPRPLVMAHRGNSALFPENSLLAFREAYTIGADVLEIDVRLSKDLVPMVFHDESLDRTTNGKGKLINYTYKELQQFDLGYSYRDQGTGKFLYRNKGLKILSLYEFFKEFPAIRVNIDIKDKISEAPRSLLEEIITSKVENRVLVSSFHHKQLKKFRNIASKVNIPTSASPLEVLAFLLHFPLLEKKEFCAYQVPLRIGKFTIVTLNNVLRAHKQKKAVHVWTINDKKLMETLLNIGVDGIVTDQPSLLLEILNS